MNATLFGKRAFAVVIQLRVLDRSFWITGLGPEFHDKCPYKRKRHNRREDTWEKSMWTWRQRWQWHGHKSLDGLKPTDAGRERKDLSLELSTPWFHTSISRTGREDIFVVLSHPVCGNMSLQLLVVPGIPWRVATLLQTLHLSSHGLPLFSYVPYKHSSLELGPTYAILDDHISKSLITSTKTSSK